MKIFRIKASPVCSAVLDSSPLSLSPSVLSFCLFPLLSHRDQKKFFCTGAPPSILPSRKHTHTHRRTLLPPTHTHLTHTPATCTHSPPASPAEAFGLSHLLPTQPISPPLSYPPSQHMQPLPWVRWQGHWPRPRPRDRGEGAHM